MDLRRAPEACGDEPGGLCIVDFRMLSIRVGKVDTVTGDVYLKLAVVLYWTDARLANHPQYAKGQPLPCDLWGPSLMLVNSHMRPEIDQTAFVLENAETGRLKRQIIYEATIDNPMSLHNFPFDMDAVEVYFMTSSDWMSLDMTTRGNVAHGRTYRLREMPRHAGSLAHRLLGGARSSKRVVPANADTSRPAKSAARNEHLRRHSMSTGCFSPKKSDVRTRGSLSSFMMDSHNSAPAKDTDDANTTAGASRRASS